MKIITILGSCVTAGVFVTSAHAAFVQPDLLNTDKGTFNASYSVSDIVGGDDDSVSSGTDTISASDPNAGNGWASATVVTYPATITFDFTVSQNLEAFYLWNASGGGNEGPLSRGVGGFSLEFFDGAGGAGSSLGTELGLLADQAPQTGNYAAQEFTFSEVSGVQSVVMTITSNQGGSNWVGFREAGFETVPEPSSISLLGLGGVALLLRRRK